MNLLQFRHNKEIKLGIKTDRGILDVKQASVQLNMATPTTIQDVIVAGDEATQAIRKLIEAASDAPSLFLDEKKLNYQPVVSDPEKIVCVGLNYQSHVEESDMELPSSPVLFSKFNNTLASHNQTISLPKVATKYDYEAELVIVMGKEAKDVTEEEALSYVFGYSVGNDLSARDLQFKSGQWLTGKTLDHFAPIGPYLVTADAVDPTNLAIECSVNGEKRQSSNTKHMIFNCSSLISYISQYMTLKPDDVIFSGTPEGVILGNPEEEQVWLQPGDVVEVSIENVGTLENTLI